MAERKPIGQILKEMDLVTESQLQEALAIQRGRGGMIGQVFVRLGYVASDEIHLALSAQIGMVVLDLFEMPPEFLDGIERDRPEVTFDPAPQGGTDPLIESPPVVKLVQLVLSTALGAGATEVRFERRHDRFDIRYRVDEILYEMESPPRFLAPPLLSRLRLLTGLTDGPRDLTVTFDGHRYRATATSIRHAEEESIVLVFFPIL